MHRLHIVEKYHSYAMQRMAAPLFKLQGIEVTQGEEVDETADINLHMPWHHLENYEPTGESKHVAVFTHANPGSDAYIYKAGMKADIITAMSFEGRQKLIKLGIDPRKIRVIYCGTDHTQFRKRNIGMVASKQPNGRKRGHILLDLAWHMQPDWLNLMRFYIIGKGWGSLVSELEAVGVDVVHVDGIENDKDMMDFYHTFDVLLSTAYEEGGPMPIVEAMKSGVKILTPDYGFTHDLLTDIDKYKNVEELESKLIKMFEHDVDNAMIASLMTWKSYVEDYAMICMDLVDTPVLEVESSGSPRYHRLMQIVDQVKPRNIMEVGTWSGKRASQMIQRAAGFRPIDTITYAGFDLFEEMDENLFRQELSKYPPPKKIVERFLQATNATIRLWQGNSAKTLPSAEKTLSYQKQDLIFIDGGHRADTIKLDWENVQRFMDEDTVVVFDDYYLDRPDALAGYGCNDLLDGLDPQIWHVLVHQFQATTHENERMGKVTIALAEVKLA